MQLKVPAACFRCSTARPSRPFSILHSALPIALLARAASQGALFVGHRQISKYLPLIVAYVVSMGHFLIIVQSVMATVLIMTRPQI